MCIDTLSVHHYSSWHFLQKLVLFGVAAIEDKLQEVSVEGGLERGLFTV